MYDTNSRRLHELIAQGEHQQQDFKYKVTDAIKLARSVSAFANTDGGRLLIGVRDDGHLSGVRSEEEIYMMHAAAWKYCKPESAIKFETLHAQGRTIVIVTVPPSTQKPVFAIDENGKRTAYIRVNDENIVASPVHLEIWKQERAPTGTMTTISDDERKLLHTTENLVEATLNRIIKSSGINRRKAIIIIAKMVRFGLIRMLFTDHRFVFRESGDDTD